MDDDAPAFGGIGAEATTRRGEAPWWMMTEGEWLDDSDAQAIFIADEGMMELEACCGKASQLHKWQSELMKKMAKDTQADLLRCTDDVTEFLRFRRNEETKASRKKLFDWRSVASNGTEKESDGESDGDDEGKEERKRKTDGDTISESVEKDAESSKNNGEARKTNLAGRKSVMLKLDGSKSDGSKSDASSPSSPRRPRKSVSRFMSNMSEGAASEADQDSESASPRGAARRMSQHPAAAAAIAKSSILVKVGKAISEGGPANKGVKFDDAVKDTPSGASPSPTSPISARKRASVAAGRAVMAAKFNSNQ